MSLKALHIVFVCATLALDLFVGGWAWLKFFSEERTMTHLIYGCGSIVMIGVIVWYARYFLRKLRTLSYL